MKNVALVGVAQLVEPISMDFHPQRIHWFLFDQWNVETFASIGNQIFTLFRYVYVKCNRMMVMIMVSKAQ